MPDLSRYRRRLRRFLLIAYAATLTAPLAACGGGRDAAATPTLTVGFVVDPSWAQIPVAQQAGYFSRHGLNVKVIDFATGVEALQALQGGQVDVTTTADVPAASALAKSKDMRVVADGSRWNGSLIVARRGSGVTRIGQLAGKKIGTPLGTSAAYFATSVLTAARVRAKLIQVAPPAMLSAMSQGNVDAVSIFQPYQAQVIQTLGADAVTLKSAGPVYSQHSLYLANARTMHAKPTALKSFFTALAQAGTDLTNSDPKAIAAVAQATDLKPGLVRTILPEFDYRLQLKPDLATVLSGLSTWARANGYLDPKTPVANYGARLDAGTLPAP